MFSGQIRTVQQIKSPFHCLTENKGKTYNHFILQANYNKSYPKLNYKLSVDINQNSLLILGNISLQ